MLAVGEYKLGADFDDRLMRIAAGFGGGVAGTHEYICGALSGGIILLGLLHGRTDPTTPDDVLYGYIKRYRERFIAEIGGSICKDLRDNGPYGPNGPLSCRILGTRAAKILLECLD